MIFSVSTMSVGIKKKKKVIIIASSCTGRCRRDSGYRSRSMASVRTMGLVVYVNRLVPAIRQMMRTAMMMVYSMLSG